MMYIITQVLMAKKPEPPVALPLVEKSPYSIAIENASWGLNCRIPSSDKNKSDSYLQSDDNKMTVKENNVLYTVSNMCNGKSSCEILIDPIVLGGDPLATCGYKILEIEYRCFTIDRLRKTTGTDGALIIDCDKQFSTP